MLLCSPLVLTAEGKACVVEWVGSRAKRVVRSSMACEVAGAGLGFEYGDYIRAVLAELFVPGANLRQWRKEVSRWPLYVALDAKTVSDCLESDNMPSDRRVAIDVCCLREAIASETQSAVRWLPGPQEPADELTKMASNLKLSELVQRCSFGLVEADTVSEERERQREALKQRKLVQQRGLLRVCEFFDTLSSADPLYSRGAGVEA